ncbi:pleurocidin-like peptide WF3 [Sparus aurata]|uniref:pleurocidin-like peptide WF3 n=1 Tax=Sparus aurata TaxID=8175 RepID=UPI0011C1619D|nr:pleurocidin-like peptide WF3 [Sparus aurata]
MKLIAVFLVLSMVVLMAEPADGFIGWLIKGAISAGKAIHGAIRRRFGDLQQEQLEQLEQQQQQEQQQQLEKRAQFLRLG